MANKSTAERDIHITTAACLFVTYTRDAKEIANILKTTDRTIHRYAETELWEEILQIVGYEGERSFRVEATRDTARDYGEVFEKAKEIFIAAVRQGHSNWKAAGIAAEKLGLTQKRVSKWSHQFGWRDKPRPS